ncbi:hypothetical protein DFA_01766 [Cavenderia fasciculata]|uniref:Crinkler family protein n=1 Tax=Cavenderia fasciculata TaxID=261658 RepID=F4PUL6_CACFS|nr:uncharacterized protein DFA_01766 [Cavenderia fasciculata]EGG21880.1 hypothetical protein DFA_01766 [Cavenderia fasciculata]|eukprot:XP_004359731.1 hypothetical protein DFA_01766 [Cavenderia fasciculata]
MNTISLKHHSHQKLRTIIFITNYFPSQALTLSPSKKQPNPTPFVDRDSFYRHATNVCLNNYNNRNLNPSTEKKAQNHRFILIPGGVGIGKTRAGKEIADIPEDILWDISQDKEFVSAMRDPIHCYINLNCGGQCFGDLDHEVKELRIGARIVLCQDSECETLFALKKKYNGYDGLDFDTVIKSLLANNPSKLTAIIIHIDEYQFYIDRAMEVNGMDFKAARSFFKEMLRVIGGHMLANTSDFHFIIPICTGTSDNDVHYAPTENSVPVFNLVPLDREKCDDVINFYLTNNKELIGAPYFKIAIQDTGYIPFLLIELLQKANNQIVGFAESVYQEFVVKWTKLMEGLLMSERDKKLMMNAICALAFSHTPVPLDFPLLKLPNGEFTIDDASRTGILYLTPKKNKLTFHVFIPFMMLKWLNNYLDNKFFHPDLLFFPSAEFPWDWLHFEYLFPPFFVCRVAALRLSRTLNQQQKPLLFKSIFRGASGNQPTSAQRLPMHGSKDDKGGKFLTLIQCKHSGIGHNGNKIVRVEPKDLREWYKGVMKEIIPAKGESMILVYATNREICFPDKRITKFNQYCEKNKLNNLTFITQPMTD